MGWLTKILILINVLVFILESALDLKQLDYVICLKPVLDGQIYRIVSATFSHADFKHIFFNMITMLLFSPPLEKHHGFYCYTLVNAILIIGQHLMALLMMYFMTLMPEALYGGKQYYYRCSLGYSGVLYAYLILWSYIGDKEISIFGFCKLRKIFFPWIWIVVNQLMGTFVFNNF